MGKLKVVKDFDKISEEVLAQIKLEYPNGFQKKLIIFKNIKGKFVSALPFETEDKHYLIRMTQSEAEEIINEDDDYGEDGSLTEDAKMRLGDVMINNEEE